MDEDDLTAGIRFISLDRQSAPKKEKKKQRRQCKPKKPEQPYDRDSATEFLEFALNAIAEEESKQLDNINKVISDSGPHVIQAVLMGQQASIHFGNRLMELLETRIGIGCGVYLNEYPSGIVADMDEHYLVISDDKRRLSSGSMVVKFGLNTKIIETKKQILTRLPKSSLFPVTPILSEEEATAPLTQEESDKYEWKSELNDIQKQVVHVACKLEPEIVSPMLIRGPPGTGKTTTLVEVLVQILRRESNAYIIVCTPSNRAANNIIERIPDEIRPITVRVQSEAEKVKTKESRLTGIKYTTSFPGRIDKFKIAVCTIGLLHQVFDDSFNPKFYPTHIIIDESSQVPDTDILFVLDLITANSKFIMFGDDRQLGPVITADKLRHTLLNVSMFERLLRDKQFEASSICLLDNYRSVPEIVRTFNTLFYNGTLRTKMNSESVPEMFANAFNIQEILLESEAIKKVIPPGVYFSDIVGKCQRGESSSWRNDSEAKEVGEIYKKLIAGGIKPETIGVISPYMDQSKWIRKIIKQPSTIVGTVDSFQGQERDIIIISTVRSEDSKGIGFVDEPKRFNVTLSRAKLALILVGDKNHLQKNSRLFEKLFNFESVQYLEKK